MILYTADFETGIKRDVLATGYYEDANTDKEALDLGYNRVILYGLCPIADPDNSNVKCGYQIDLFFLRLFMLVEKHKCDIKVYFHNLSFDGEFILEYLLSEHWVVVDNKKKLENNELRVLITDQKVWYSIELGYKGYVIYIKDSYKLLAQSEDKILKDFKIDVSKIGVDWEKQPPLFVNGNWREPNELEIKRVRNDVLGMAKVLNLFKNDSNSPIYMKKDTAATCAFDSLKMRSFPGRVKGVVSPNKDKKIPNSNYEIKFRNHYPVLYDPYYIVEDKNKERITFDSTLRLGYYGGFCYTNPKYASQTLKDVVAYDQNSKYPFHMRNEKFPYGQAMTEETAKALAIDDNDLKNNYLYIAHLKYVEASLKPNWIPWIQRRGYDYHGVEMLKHIQEDEMVLSQPLYELFLESYKLSYKPIVKKYYFCSEPSLFKDHVDFWTEQKIKASEENNGALKFFAKIQLNSSYGKFAQRLERKHKLPEWSFEKKQVIYKTVEPNYFDKNNQRFYLPVGLFITGYGRADIVRKAHSFGDNFVYCDTDSLHLLNGPYTEKELSKHNIIVDKNKLGAWKLDKTYTEARYLHAKCYAGITSDKTLDVHIAGYNYDSERYNLSLNNIYVGAKLPGKRSRRKCRGGCYLEDTEFNIKDISQEDTIS